MRVLAFSASTAKVKSFGSWTRALSFSCELCCSAGSSQNIDPCGAAKVTVQDKAPGRWKSGFSRAA